VVEDVQKQIVTHENHVKTLEGQLLSARSRAGKKRKHQAIDEPIEIALEPAVTDDGEDAEQHKKKVKKEKKVKKSKSK
jgi:hypothetical protein